MNISCTAVLITIIIVSVDIAAIDDGVETVPF